MKIWFFTKHPPSKPSVTCKIWQKCLKKMGIESVILFWCFCALKMQKPLASTKWASWTNTTTQPQSLMADNVIIILKFIVSQYVANTVNNKKSANECFIWAKYGESTDGAIKPR